MKETAAGQAHARTEVGWTDPLDAADLSVSANGSLQPVEHARGSPPVEAPKRTVPDGDNQESKNDAGEQEWRHDKRFDAVSRAERCNPRRADV